MVQTRDEKLVALLAKKCSATLLLKLLSCFRPDSMQIEFMALLDALIKAVLHRKVVKIVKLDKCMIVVTGSKAVGIAQKLM